MNLETTIFAIAASRRHQPPRRPPALLSAILAGTAIIAVAAGSNALAGGDAGAGRAAWSAEHARADGSPARSCASCHTADLTRAGRHAKTGKAIEPMAPSVNPERLSDPNKVEKWLYRNCRWTLDRECTAAEKADFLAYIRSQ